MFISGCKNFMLFVQILLDCFLNMLEILELFFGNVSPRQLPLQHSTIPVWTRGEYVLSES